MIVRESPADFVCITQHDHARLSGWFGAVWGNEELPTPAGGRSLILASALHDVGWISLDRSPCWNEASRRPYSFLDEPLERKLPGYTAGIDLVAEQDPYAGLLCSLHYTAFFGAGDKEAIGPQAVEFLKEETKRQAALRTRLVEMGHNADVSRAALDLGYLKLWDNLSLYVSINKPGISKLDEHPWYRAGFPPTALKAGQELVRFQARWLDQNRVKIEPFPLKASLSYGLPFRQVSKKKVEKEGFTRAYGAAPVSIKVIAFV